MLLQRGCAVTAQNYGADRIELCAAPKEGGLTPSYGVLKAARQAVTIPVHPIIRPRGGDFCYTAGEFGAMLDDIALVRDLGFPGLVTGLLDEDGNIDLPRMRQVMSAAQGSPSLFIAHLICVEIRFRPLKRLENLAWRAF